jgi:gas vesicle protein
MLDEHKGTVFAAGFFIGAAMGAIVALTLAPTSGKRLRRDLARESRKVAHRASETAARIRDTGSDAYERAREAVG